MELVQRPPLEVWGGLECTYNRVGERFADQCALNGHDRRLEDDIEAFAALGVKRIRYPVLWEKVAPSSPDVFDWSTTDRALTRLRSLKPIVGLVHHGSGPRYTSLLDPEFPARLASFAGEVAKRYPWVDAYTPVNEPLTTARFSGLYGFWYPHHRSDSSFVRMLYNELKGVILAMREIRKVNPAALLIQTEDLGLAKGTPPLQYQVDFENMRRWLTFDLLSGRVDERHYLYQYLIDRGELTKGEIAWFQENALAPDVIGINHYPLSNRFLDHRLELYPPQFHGGNGRDSYVDVGAVDTGQVTPPTPEEILLEVWERYRKPIAVTEAHISGPREAQMRWLHEVWSAADHVRSMGGDVRAVTAWSLLGSYGWTSLCTCEPGQEIYESGVFDNRSAQPRETALGRMIRSYAREGTFEHPLLERGGYWTEPSRVLFAPPEHPLKWTPRKARPILITGAGGMLGRAFARICTARGLDFVALDRAQMDICSEGQVRRLVREIKPWAVINTAGYSRIESAEREPEFCFRDNAHGVRVLARVCNDEKLPFLTFSTDLVFSGDQREPYSESAKPAPLNVYGHSKLEAERAVGQLHDQALIVRTSSLFSPWEHRNFLTDTLRSLRLKKTVRAIEDMWASPTYVPHLVSATLDLLIDGERGLLHLANEGAVTWKDWAHLAAQHARADRELIQGVSGSEFKLLAPRPAYSALRTERLQGLMPDIEQALGHFIQSTEGHA